MTLVERLRNRAVGDAIEDDLMKEAADRIETLEKWQDEATSRLLKAGADWYDQKKRVEDLEHAYDLLVDAQNTAFGETSVKENKT